MFRSRSGAISRDTARGRCTQHEPTRRSIMQIVGLVSFPCGRLAPSALCTSEAAGHIGGGGTTCQSGEARDGRRMAVGGGMEKRTLALATAIFAPTQLQSTPKDTSAKEPASMNCRVRAMQTSCSERAVTSRVAGHRAAPQRLPRPAAGDRAFSSSKFWLSRVVWRSASDLVGRSVLGRHQANRRVHRWRLACAIPEDRGQHHKEPGKHSSSRATTPTASIVGSRSGS